MTSTAAEVGATYFDAWRAGDFDTLRSILADDVTFENGKITSIRVTFDPRPLSPPPASGDG
jgi:hypothetical protein